jgi:hypothetical protein
MVTGDHGRHGFRAVLLMALLGCGCLQTQTGGGPFRMAASSARNTSSAAEDGGVVLAVAKPAPHSAGSTTDVPPQLSDGPDVMNPVQTVSAKTNAPETEQGPPPRQMPTDPTVQTPPGANQQPKDAAAPAPANTAAQQPGQPARQAPAPGVASRNPPGAAPGQPGGVPLDPHRRQVPTAAGSLLNLPPGESPVERAVELSYRIQALDADRQVLEQRARELTAALESRDRALVQHGRDLHEAAEEVARARTQVANWRKELEEARIRLKSRELEDVQTLKAIIALLERLTEPKSGPDARHEDGPGRMPEE